MKRRNPAKIEISLIDFNLDLSKKERRLMQMGDDVTKEYLTNKIEEIKNTAIDNIIKEKSSFKQFDNKAELKLLSKAIQKAFAFLDKEEIDYSAATLYEIIQHYTGSEDIPVQSINTILKEFQRDEIKLTKNGTPYFQRHIKKQLGIPQINEDEDYLNGLNTASDLLKVMNELKRISQILYLMPTINPQVFSEFRVNTYQIEDQLFANTVGTIAPILKAIPKNEKFIKIYDRMEFKHLFLTPLYLYSKYLMSFYGHMIDDSFNNIIALLKTEMQKPQIHHPLASQLWDWGIKEYLVGFEEQEIRDPLDGYKQINLHISSDLFNLASRLFNIYWSNRGQRDISENYFFKKKYIFEEIGFGNQSKYRLIWDVHLPHHVLLKRSVGGQVYKEKYGFNKVYLSDKYEANKGGLGESTKPIGDIKQSLVYYYAINILNDVFKRSILTTQYGKKIESGSFTKYVSQFGLPSIEEFSKDIGIKFNKFLAGYSWLETYLKLHKSVVPNYQDGMYVDFDYAYAIRDKERVLVSLVDGMIPTPQDMLYVSTFDFFDKNTLSQRLKESSESPSWRNTKLYIYNQDLKTWRLSEGFDPIIFTGIQKFKTGYTPIYIKSDDKDSAIYTPQVTLSQTIGKEISGQLNQAKLSFFDAYNISFLHTNINRQQVFLKSSQSLRAWESVLQESRNQATNEPIIFDQVGHEGGNKEKTPMAGKFVGFGFPLSVSPSSKLRNPKKGGRVTAIHFTDAQLEGLKQAAKVAREQRKIQLKINLETKLSEIEQEQQPYVEGSIEECRSKFKVINDDQLKDFSVKDALENPTILRAWEQIQYSLSENTLNRLKQDREEEGKFEELLIAKTTDLVKKLNKAKFKQNELAMSFNYKELKRDASTKGFEYESDSVARYINLGNTIGKFLVYRETNLKDKIDEKSKTISFLPHNKVYVFLVTEYIETETDFLGENVGLYQKNEPISVYQAQNRKPDYRYTRLLDDQDRKQGFARSNPRRNPSEPKEELLNYTCGLLKNLAKGGYFFEYSNASHGKSITEVGEVFKLKDTMCEQWKLNTKVLMSKEYRPYKKFLGKEDSKKLFTNLSSAIELPKDTNYANGRYNLLSKLASEGKIQQSSFDHLKSAKGIYIELQNIPKLCQSLDDMGLFDLSFSLRILFMDDPSYRVCNDQEKLRGKAYISEIKEQSLQKKIRETTRTLFARNGIITKKEKKGDTIISVPVTDIKGRPIHFTPYEYQKIGIYFAKMLNFKCLIGDDMGLGKTVQGMCSLKVAEELHKKNPKLYPNPFPCVTVCPANIQEKWKKEWETWFPEYKPVIFKKQSLLEGKIKKENKVIISSYEGLRNDKTGFNYFINLDANFWIFDECHRIKNYLTSNCMYAFMYMGLRLEPSQIAEFFKEPKKEATTEIKPAVKLWDVETHGSIKKNNGLFRDKIAPYRILLSGTPMENNYTELFSIFKVCNPEKFPVFQAFNMRYNPSQIDENGIKRTDLDIMRLLQAELDCFMIRRFKKQVFTDNPDSDDFFPTKDRFPLITELPIKSRQAYDIISEMLLERMMTSRIQKKTELAAKWFLGTATQKMLQEANRKFYERGEIDEQTGEIKAGKIKTKYGAVGRALTRKAKFEKVGKKVVDKIDNKSFKIKQPIEQAVLIANEFIEDVSESMQEQLDPEKINAGQIGMNAMMDLIRIVGKAKVQSAAIFIQRFFYKPEEFLSYYVPREGLATSVELHRETYLEKHQKGTLQLVVFIKHRAVAKQVKEACDKLRLSSNIVPLAGQTKEERAELTDQFQQGLYKVIIGSQAIREGINLYSANHMLFVELWWVPARMEQAEDRIWRIGQELPCSIFYLVGSKTIDEKVYGKLEKKKVQIKMITGSENIVEQTEEEDQIKEITGEFLNQKFINQQEIMKKELQELGESQTTPQLVADYLEVPLFLVMTEPNLARRYSEKRIIKDLFLGTKDAKKRKNIEEINEILELCYLNTFQKVFGTEKTNYKKAGKFLKNNYIKYKGYPLDGIEWVTRKSVDSKEIEIKEYPFPIFKIDLHIDLDDAKETIPQSRKSYIDMSSVNLELCRKYYKTLLDLYQRISGVKRLSVQNEQLSMFLELLIDVKNKWDALEKKDLKDKSKLKVKLEEKLKKYGATKSKYVSLDGRQRKIEDAIKIVSEQMTDLSDQTYATYELRKDMQGLLDSVGYSFEGAIISNPKVTRNDYWALLKKVPTQSSSFKNVYQLLQTQIQYSDPAYVFKDLPDALLSKFGGKIEKVLKQMKSKLYLE